MKLFVYKIFFCLFIASNSHEIDQVAETFIVDMIKAIRAPLTVTGFFCFSSSIYLFINKITL